MTAHPLTLGTAGHIDHGKTALIGALTGVQTDRLEEERRRGISIELGYAPLTLPSGRRLSIVDVPGHERFVRTMVAGATGIDLFLMCIAADDGVMPQTREHAKVLAGLGVRHGVVAITKADLRDPAEAAAQAAELVPSAEAVAVSARTGQGIDELRAALDRAAAALPGRAADDDGVPVLHVDRSFTIRGAGTVVTGTLWSGAVGRGDEVVVLPAGLRARVRGVEVHDEPCERAEAGQRVAVNLVGPARDEVGRGDVVTSVTASMRAAYLLDVALDVRLEHGTRVQVHHGTRETPARIGWLGGRYHQLRCEEPLVARRGDRLVVRAIAPPDTLGGGVVLDPAARKHGPSREVVERLARLLRGEPDAPEPEARRPAREAAPPPARGVVAPPPLDAEARALEERYRAAGHEPPNDSELGDGGRAALFALREHGRVVRLGQGMHVHVDALAAVAERVRGICAAEGEVTLARLRDELRTTRKFAQALLERLDADRVTIRVGDVHRLRRRAS